MPDDSLYKIAYDEAVRALSEQQAAIESVRGRAGLLLSAAAVTTSFLGAQALQGDRSGLFSWLALFSFVAVSAISLGILWPRRWEFAVSPRGVIESFIGLGEIRQVEDLYRDLSLQMYRSCVENHRGLKRLAIFFQAASGLLTIEVVLWVAAITLSL
jgi:hypothetical protein